MAIRKFSVGGRKTLVLARHDDLPDLTIVTGGNGSGKSSFLSLLRDERIGRANNTKVMHLGPHRPWRKEPLDRSSMFDMPSNYSDILSSLTFPTFTGTSSVKYRTISGKARDVDASDEAQSFIKITLANVNERYKERLSKIHSSKGAVGKGDVSPPFLPLQRLLATLLPHLEFIGIDESNKANIRVLFSNRLAAQANEFDIDDLSSGEKAVLTLFLPVLEHQIGLAIGEVPPTEYRSILIDEPEIHLHPALQADVIAYMRELVANENLQFILVTHSPTIIDSALPSELFMITPWQSSTDGNQFVRIADTADRLSMLRDLLGSAFRYTRGRPLLFIEGEFPEDTARATDQGILELILPELRKFVLVPSRGRQQAASSAERIRRAALDQEHAVTAFALVDADYTNPRTPWEIPWPVCMVENLLLHPDAMAAVLSPYRARGAISSTAAARSALSGIAVSLRDNEIERRLKAIVGVLSFRPEIAILDTKTDIRFNQKKIAEEVEAALKVASISAEKVVTEVDEAIELKTFLSKFHGKELLKKFFELHVQKFIPNYQNFVFTLASEVAHRGSARKMVSTTLAKLEAYFPPSFSELLTLPDVREAIEECGLDVGSIEEWARRRLEAFDKGIPVAASEKDLGRDLVRVSRRLHDRGSVEAYDVFRAHLVDILSS